MKTFLIKTLGCKVNQCESEAIAAALALAGWRPAAKDEAVAVCIVNTCAVTSRAAMQSRQMIRRCRRKYPGARILATGCYATVDPEKLCQTGGVDGLVEHADKTRIPEIVARQGPLERSPGASGPGPAKTGFPMFAQAPPVWTRTRPFLKIQDGCDSFCTYCIVPYARGRSVSMPVAAVLSALEDFSRAGYREVVLTGIHLGLYGQDLVPPLGLTDLLARIAARSGLERVRISSLEPGEISDSLIGQVAQEPLFCDHFHIPLQSGDDRILGKMGRPYDRAFFADRVRRISAELPGAAIGVDVLVGFPGEDAAAFEQTCALIRELPVSYLHVFPFSPRPGTPAASLPDPVAAAIIKDRCRYLRQLSREKMRLFCTRQQGQVRKVLLENQRDQKTGELKGLTGNYLTVLMDHDDDQLLGQTVQVKIGPRREKMTVTGTRS